MFICIHGHFYQPPRDNPWRPGHIEPQPSAAPFADWNQRITAECYAPNAAARVLATNGRIKKLVNNYERISFDFGPTLLQWLEQHDKRTYQAVIDADKRSVERFSGHGGGMAQAFNHTILPLASAADKRTQIEWGLADFQKRFGRPSEGMWLPECAVDTPTLEALADAKVKFTVLAPGSLAAVRPLGAQQWQTTDRSSNRAYSVPLPSGRSMCVFFYNGDISRSVAFSRLLDDGVSFARALAAGGKDTDLVHIATDGESYGHHHHFGEMALSFALEWIDDHKDLTLTTYGEYLTLHPPQWEAQINEPSSWSCAHGVERWRSDCGCRGGRYQTGNQAWRTPLRAALDELRVSLAQAKRAELFTQLMYTSCGWFFDEPSDLETAQILAYAARALELAEAEGLPRTVRARFVEQLEAAKSQLPEWQDARRVFEVTEAEQAFSSRLQAFEQDPFNTTALQALLLAAQHVRPSFDLRLAQNAYEHVRQRKLPDDPDWIMAFTQLAVALGFANADHLQNAIRT